MGLVGEIASRTKVGPHPEDGIRGPGGGHDDVGALSNAEGYDVGSVGLDRDEVVGHDCHIVAIDSEALNTFRSRINEPESVRFS